MRYFLGPLPEVFHVCHHTTARPRLSIVIGNMSSLRRNAGKEDGKQIVTSRDIPYHRSQLDHFRFSICNREEAVRVN